MNAKGIDEAAFNEIRLHAVHKHGALTAKQVKRIARDARGVGVIASLEELAEDQLFADLVGDIVHDREEVYYAAVDALMGYVPRDVYEQRLREIEAFWAAYSRAMFVCGLLMGNPAGMVM
jgi:hypothetical protein